MSGALSPSAIFEEERRAATIFRDIIEALAHPVLIVDADMQILFANPAAEEMLAEQSTLSSVRGKLAFGYGPADAAVGSAVELGIGNEFALGPAGINVPIVKASAPAVAHVMPLARRDVSARFTQRAVAAIFIAEAGCGADAGA